MNMDVTKIDTIIAKANSQYSRAMSNLFGAWANCNELVAKMDNHNSGIASVGDITSVKNAIEAAGKPMPKKPFTMAANKNIPIRINVCSGSKLDIKLMICDIILKCLIH
jgi:hypothetical protein